MQERLSYYITGRLIRELPDDYLLRAQERLRQGNFVEAIEDFDKVMEFKPKDYKTLMERGCGKYEIKDANGAIQDLINSIELSPYHYLFLYNQGVNKLIHADINMIDEVSCYDKNDWDTMMTFMIDGMIRMERALINPLKIINQKMKK